MISPLRAANCQFGLGSRLLTCSKMPLALNFSTVPEPDLSSYHKSQVDQLDDKCILVDKMDRIIGSASKKECHIATSGGETGPGGLLHRAFSVLLFNTNNELLLQQRSSKKITYPDYYTNTCCSHPRSNETESREDDNIGIKIAAQRRLRFELGISEDQIPIKDIHFLTKIHYSAPAGNGWAENEIDHVLFIKKDVDIQPNQDEVSDVKYVSHRHLKEFLDNATKNNILVTPWFKYIYATFLNEWWKQLDVDLSKLCQCADNKIWRAGSIS